MFKKSQFEVSLVLILLLWYTQFCAARRHFSFGSNVKIRPFFQITSQATTLEKLGAWSNHFDIIGGTLICMYTLVKCLKYLATPKPKSLWLSTTYFLPPTCNVSRKKKKRLQRVMHRQYWVKWPIKVYSNWAMNIWPEKTLERRIFKIFCITSKMTLNYQCCQL